MIGTASIISVDQQIPDIMRITCGVLFWFQGSLYHACPECCLVHPLQGQTLSGTEAHPTLSAIISCPDCRSTYQIVNGQIIPE